MHMRYAAGLAVALITAGAVGCTPGAGDSTAYPDPDREVRHVIPWRAGGSTDAAMRGFMGYFERHLGTRVVTDNVPGGLSSVGLSVVARSADGVVMVASRVGNDALWQELSAREDEWAGHGIKSIRVIGDAEAPALEVG